MTTPQHPAPLLEIRFEATDLDPVLTAFCAGYEMDQWRAEQLARHLIHWLPEFALTFSEWSDLGSHNAAELLGAAARSIYLSQKYQARGEFGEVLLHVMLRQHFKSVPAISKYYYKDSANDTVKGFDAVHVVQNNGDWELWLGEVKFYQEFRSAVRDVCEELQEHTGRDYLRSEFTAITRKVDQSWPEAAALVALLNSNRSLDEIFTRVCIPVLLTYDSETVSTHRSCTSDYIAAFEAEVRAKHSHFAANVPSLPVVVKLLLLPLEKKARLVQLMDEALKRCQAAL